MGIANDIAALNGVYRKRYARDVAMAIPDGTILLDEFGFDSANALGEDWNEPVSLTSENGFTLVEAEGANSPLINEPIAGTTKNANVNSPQIYLQSEVNYEAASRAMRKGEAAIVRAINHVIRNNTESHRRCQESQIFHGQVDLGVVESSTSTTIVISKATWAPGPWAGREGLLIDVQDATLANELDQDISITSINFSTRTLTCDAVNNGAVIAGTRVFMKDACIAGSPATFREPVGIHAALTATSSVYGINPSTYTLWDAGSVSASSDTLDFDHSTEAVARVAEKGGMGLLLQIVNPHSFNDLIGDQAALRSYDEDGSTAMYRTGARAIRFFTGNGEVSVRPSIYQKRGFAFVLDGKCWSRKGSQDFSFSSPFSTEAFHVYEAKGGAFARSFSSTTPFCRLLARNALISGIVDSVAN